MADASARKRAISRASSRVKSGSGFVQRASSTSSPRISGSVRKASGRAKGQKKR